jgi:hypothetical protein
VANPSRITDFSTTAANNVPSGSEAVGTNADDLIRAIQATIRTDLANKGSDIASATTTNVGAVSGLMNDITGTTTVTGLGTVAAGVWKILKFEGALTLTHNASSLILPGGENVTTADGDTAIFFSEGSGNWRCISYFRAAVSPNSGFTTGDVKMTLKTTADVGWVLMNDGTIGNAASGGTTRANADTEDLFTLLWNNTADADCAVSTGRGLSAADDYAAAKTIALPKALGRALAVYGSGSGLTARALAAVTGTETHTLTGAESGTSAHAHSDSVTLSTNAGATATSIQATTGDGTANATLSLTTNNSTAANASSAHNNMQPTVFLNIMVKL